MRNHSALLLIICVICCNAAMKPAAFTRERLVIAPDSPDSLLGEPAAFRIDSSLYRNTNDTFTDLRLFDDQGEEIAFTVRQVTSNDTDTVVYAIPMETVSFVRNTERGSAILFKRSRDDSIPTELNIRTPLDNFEKHITIMAGTTQKNWVTLAEKQPIFDYSQFLPLRNTRVSFKAGKYRFYKIIIDSIWDLKQSAFSHVITETRGEAVSVKYTKFIRLQEPFRFDDVEFTGTTQRIRYGGELIEQNVLRIDSTREDTTMRCTKLYLTSDRKPVVRLSVTVADNNFSRHATVYTAIDSVPEKNWRSIGATQLSSISLGNYQHHNLELPLSYTVRAARFMIRIENKDNAPIEVTAVTGEGPRHEVVFFHHNKRHVRLCYGAENPEPPQYDITDVLENAPVVRGSLWKLGEVREQNPEVPKTTPVNPEIVLMAVLGLMVVVLVFVLSFAIRKVEKVNEEGQ